MINGRPSRGPSTALGGGGGARRSTAVAKKPSLQRWQILAAAIVLVMAVWLLWPSELSGVKNLDSRGLSIVAFGDSLTAGYGASADQAYPAQLSRTGGVDVVNAGVSGSLSVTVTATVRETSPGVETVSVATSFTLSASSAAETVTV